MRLLSLILFLVTLTLFYSLWFSDSGRVRVKDLENKLTEQQEINQALQARNEALLAEVQELKGGAGAQAVEERARLDLGMILEDEIFVRIVPAE
ncbi:MAG TPA: septum formation initiator family protein [Paenalcaligenes sp.]|nr:septum formation initiator family protein [Paenalcaligenes sp.]